MDIIDELTESQLLELEGALSFGLTLHEVLRRPRIVDPVDYEVFQTTLNDSGLREELTCAICSGIISKCVVIKTCLHRFCSACIEKSVRVGSHGCPKCRKHVPSRRFFRSDPIYDSIISRIVSNVEVFEELSDTFTMAINKGMKNDVTLDKIRLNYLNENPRIRIEDVKRVGELHQGEFSMESKFDNKIYLKEVKEKRREYIKSLPRPLPFHSLLFQILTDDTLPQIFPETLSCDGCITIHQLYCYIKTTLKLSPNSEICLYLKEFDYIPTPEVTLAFLRNIVSSSTFYLLTQTCTMSHEILIIYYGSCHLKL